MLVSCNLGSGPTTGPIMETKAIRTSYYSLKTSRLMSTSNTQMRLIKILMRLYLRLILCLNFILGLCLIWSIYGVLQSDVDVGAFDELLG